ncbi:MAG: type II toxin-antitoxin system RelE/ParE family toxin [Acidobacteriota bacterium]
MSNKIPTPKSIVWMGDSLEKVRSFPHAVKEEIGFALYQAQTGGKHVNAKPLKGLGSGVMEVVSEYRSDTYRAVYTISLGPKVYVLHAFQKKSKKGIATPKPDIELIRHRLKRAIVLYKEQGN